MSARAPFGRVLSTSAIHSAVRSAVRSAVKPAARSPLRRVLALLLVLLLGGTLAAPASAAPASPGTASEDDRAAPAQKAPNSGGAVDITDGLPGDFAGLGVSERAEGAGSQGSARRSTEVDDKVRSKTADGADAPVIIRLREQVDSEVLQEKARAAGVRAVHNEMAALQRGDLSNEEQGARLTEAAQDARATAVVDELRATARANRGGVADLLEEAKAAGHASKVRPYWVFNGFAATIDRAALDQLAAHPDVESVTFDAQLRLPETELEDDPKLPTWGLERVHAPKTWGEYGERGEGVVVGVMDSGADGGHPAIADAWRGKDGDPAKSWFVPTGEDYPTPGDGAGHGTHVTGTIVGGPPGDVTGVAPGAEWIAAKIFNDFGGTSTSIIHAGFEWMLAPGGDPAAAPDVVNNSWGSPQTYNTEFWDDVNAWVAAGIVPIFANGNDGPAPQTVGSPGSFPQSIGVGATDVNDVVAGFSSRGGVTWDGVEMTKPQVAAPGHHIYSAWPRDLSDSGYATISGTSMASPHATGVVALMLASAPDLTVDEARGLLEDTARAEPHMGTLPDNDFGHGVVDSYAAVSAAAHSATMTGTVTGPDGPVEATIAVAGVDWATTTSTAGGEYALTLPAGSHQLRVTAPGHAPTTVSVEVAAKETYVEDISLAPAKSYTVSGTVTGGSDALGGARVFVEADGVEPTYTDADGTFSVEVPEGTHDVQIVATGYAPWRGEVTVDGAEVLDRVLEPLGTATEPGWRQFQNNATRTGLSPAGIAAESLRQSWEVDTGPGVTFSSPVIADGAAYVNTDDGRLVALDLATGETLWSHQTSDTLRGAPTVDDGVVYVGGGTGGGIFALDAETGEPVWERATPGLMTVYTAPTVVDDTVYAVTGPTPDASDTVYALDRQSGEVRWQRDVGTSVFAGPAVAADHLLVANADDAAMSALDPETGDVQWTLDRTERDDYFVGGLSLADGVVHAATTHENGWDGSMLAVDVETGEVLWEDDSHGDGQGTTPAVYGDLVIAGAHSNGAMVAYDRATGEVAWRHNNSGPVSSSPLVSSDGYVIAGSQLDNQVFAVDAVTGKQVWSDTMTANVTSTAAFAEGTLLTADTSGLVRAYTATGTVRGIVTGPDGPVQARVELVGTGESVTSDAETGAYRIDHKPGSYEVRASAYGLRQQTQTVELAAGRVVGVDFTLTPVGTGTLTGQVVDEQGESLAGATVTLQGAPVEATTTDGSGQYALTDVAAGTYTVRIELAGYQTAEIEAVVVEGETVTADATLQQYEVAVIGDYEGRMLAELTELGYRAQPSTYDEVTAAAGAYEAVVANGADDEPAAEVLQDFIDATDDAGTSVVWLDQWSIGYGSISHLSRGFGDPAEIIDSYSGSGRVGLIAREDHPLTDGLTHGELTEILVPEHEWSAFAGYSGRSVADVFTDEDQLVGSGLAYKPRSTGGVHVLVANLAAAPWGDPQTEWTDAGHTVLDNAVGYAMAAGFGEVAGTVTGPDGPLAATVTVTATGESTTAGADGSYSLLLPPGQHTLRYSHPGMESVERPVDVSQGATENLDVTLALAGKGTVSGTVTDGGGNAVAGAEVSLDGTELTATTADDGGYTIAEVPAETYTLRVSADEYLTATQEVTVTADQTATVDVTLHRAARVGVLGDYRGAITATLLDRELVAEEIGWNDVDRVDDFDVIVFNDADDPGADTFEAWMQAMDTAQVSGVFHEAYFSSDGSARFLREYEGNPSDVVRVRSNEGETRYQEVIEDHPIFDGVGADPVVLRPDRYSGAIAGYTGFTVADLVTDRGTRGAGVAYQPRSAGSVHVLMGGMHSDILQNIEDDWTAEGIDVYVNAISWAATPELGAVQGAVTDESGGPLDGTVEVVGTRQQAQLDDEGGYRLDLPPGDFTLRFTAYGYVAEEADVTVTEGGEATIDATLATVDGATTVSGEVTSGGEPVVGAEVRLLDHPRAAASGADGSYALEVIEPGEYTLEVTADDHVRYRAQVSVAAGEATVHDVDLAPTARIGVLDDYSDAMAEYLTYWGYRPVEIAWEDTDQLADLDLVIANMGSYSGHDPGPEGFAAFDRAAVEAGLSVVWLDQFGRGSFRYLNAYTGDPGVTGQGRNDGTTTATVVDSDHPVFAGLPASFELVEPDAEHSWFGDFNGEVLATVSSDETSDGGLVGVRPRGTHAVDLLVGTLSISTYGSPAYGGVAADVWTPEAERLLRNTVSYALSPGATGSVVEGTLRNTAGDPLSGTVTVAESGHNVPVAADGAYTLALPPGTWTLQGESFGHEQGSAEVTLEAGETVEQDLVLDRSPLGAVVGTVTDSDGAPVEGAAVSVVDTPLTAVTAADGGYQLSDVPAGSWTVEVTADGFQYGRAEVEVTEGSTATVDVQLEPSRQVALVEDYRSSITELLTGEGYTVTNFAERGIAGLTDRVGDFDVVILNDSVFSYEEDVLPLLDAAAEAEVSVIFGGQWGGDAIGTLSDLRGDPEDVDYSFVPEPIAYTAAGDHPIFAGFESGTPIELMRNPSTGGNQQWQSYVGYSGTTIANVSAMETGTDLGEAVGYQFTSTASVEILLASLAASGYGYPGERWTDDAERIYLNAVAWAADATQGSVNGVVTSEGEPVAGATVTVAGTGATTTTGEDGGYSMGLMDGEHTLVFTAEGFEPHEETVTIVDAATVTRDVELTALPRGAIEGTVTDSEGAPVVGAEVTASGQSEWSATTGADGRFAKDDLLEGEYTVQVSAHGYLPAQESVTVAAGEPAVVEIELEPLNVAVLGDVGTTMQDLLRDHDVAAGAVEWSSEPDFSTFDTVVVNGPGDTDVDQALFDAMVAAADAEEVSVVYTGTWGVDQGGLRLLEQFSDRVVVADQGYGDGPVTLTRFDAEHPLFDGLADPSRLVVEGGYYSTLAEYAGASLAGLSVSKEDGEPVSGLSAAYSWRTAGSIELVLSASAVTGTQGPDLGWTPDGERLLLNAVDWATEAEQQVPPAPTLEASETLTAAETVSMSGTAQWPSTVTLLRDGTEVAVAETAVDGTWSRDVALVEGENVLTATAANAAGESEPSSAVTAVRDTTGPEIDWQAPGDVTGSFDADITVAGAVTDAYAGVAELRLGDTDVKVSEDGTFSTEVPLAEGENELVLTAVDVLGNTSVVQRTVLHRDWAPRWQLPGVSRLVQLWLEGAPTQEPPAEEATLVVTDGDGDVVGRHDLRWTDDHYQVRLDRPPRRSDSLTAVLVVDGYEFTTQRPAT